VVPDLHRPEACTGSGRGEPALAVSRGLSDTQRLQRWVERRAVWFAIASLIAVPIPAVLGLGSSSYFGATLIILAVAALGLIAQDQDDRRFFGSLFCLGLALRLWALVAIQAWAVRSGGPYLGPDGTMYLERSLALAREGLQASAGLASPFQPYDSAHYLLFAAQIRFLDADLFGLQVLNATATALVGPFVFALGRIAGTRWAPALGLVAAVYPSIIAISVNDLWKDPVLIAGSVAGVWAVASGLWGRSGYAQWVCALVGGLLLAGVRASRGYVVPFIEVGFLGALAAQWVSHPAAPVRPRQWVVLGVAILVAEGLPASLGWPVSPAYVSAQVRHSLASPGMRFYATGLLDRITSTRGGPPHIPSAVASGETHGTLAVPPASGERSAVATIPANDHWQSWRLMTIHAANAVRRLFGPFPWVPPPSWDAETILRHDYLLFPGMIVWYALLPVGAVGAGRAAWLALRCRAVPPVVVVSSFFVTCLGAMYMALNLSYRQREFMFPFLLLTAVAAIDTLESRAFWRRAYLLYWALLLLLAIAHTTLRAIHS
jgi:hypothetical protein